MSDEILRALAPEDSPESGPAPPSRAVRSALSAWSRPLYMRLRAGAHGLGTVRNELTGEDLNPVWAGEPVGIEAKVHSELRIETN